MNAWCVCVLSINMQVCSCVSLQCALFYYKDVVDGGFPRNVLPVVI